MSRIGKMPVTLPKGVKAVVEAGVLRMEGPKGKLQFLIPAGIDLTVTPEKITSTRKSDEASIKAKHGLVRALVNNMAKGVAQGYEQKLEIVGVGYRAAVKGTILNLTVGFSHPVDFKLPDGISAKVENNTGVVISGPDKALVGEVCAKIRAVRPPEPYQGKGIKYANEKIRRKAGKAAATGK